MKFLPLILLIFSIPLCIASNIIEVNAPQLTQVGEGFEAYIYIIPGEAVAGAQCNFSFNKDVLVAENITNGGIFEYWANDIYENFTRIDNQNGRIYNIVGFSSNSTSNEGIFARIVFFAIGEGFSWLNIEDAIISDAEGNKTIIEVINRSIFVDATPPNITFYSGNEFFSKNVCIRWGAKDNYSPEEKINYSYSLNGEWSNWSNSNETFYELDVGNYSFMLKAKDEAGNIRWENLSFYVRDITPPEIKNLKIDKINNNVNISCDISDDFGVNEVFLILNQINYSMHKNNENYFFNSSLNPGKYNYSIVAIDKSNNKNISTGDFTINSPPCKPSLLNPENNSINVSINATLIAHVIDIDSDIMTVKFYGRKLGATWQLIGTKTNVENNSNVSLVWYNLEYNTTYEWYAVANDSFFENSSDTWQFTTQKAPPVNNPPVANNDYYSTNEDIQLVISALGVLANDTDIDGDTLTAIKLTDPSHGSIVFNSNGSFVYTPSLNYYGTDSFTYKAYDGKAYSNVATVHITVNPVNDAPNKPALLNPANGATGVSINPTLSWQCSDADGDELSYDIYFGTSPNPPKIVTVTTISYNPGTLSYSTTYYWRVVAKDGKEETPSDIWQFTTMAYTPSPPAANQPPTCSLNANVSHGYAPLYVNFIMNASDADGNIIAWELDVNNDGIAEYNGSALPSTVQHVYANPGNFKAKLIVRDDKGAISTANISIYVISVDFEFIPQKPAPGVGVKFFALFDAINYTWNFGDGSFAYGRNVSHAFAKEGKYRVKLIVSDGIYNYEKNYTIDVVIPDFYVEAIYLPEKPKKGDEIKIFLKIKNDGGYSENVGCYIFLDGEKQSFRFNISEEYEKEIHCVGISKIKIFVDPENEIEEKNERNNGIEISIKYAGNNLIYLAFIPVVAIPAYLLIRRKKEKKVIMGEEKIEKCSVCLGSFKEEANILRCDCGALYHKSCAKRVKNCINCNKKL